MAFINTKRLNINRNGKKDITIEIFPSKDEKDLKLLKLWVVLWSIGGGIIFIQLFQNYTKEEKLFFGVWMAFWAYFEYKAVTALKWKLFGKEVIKIADDKLEILNEIKGRGVPVQFEKSKIKDLKLSDFQDKSFSAVMGNSFWSTGGEKVTFKYGEKIYGLGKQLPEADAIGLFKLLKSNLN